MLHTLLVKHFNDLLDGQKSQRSIDKVTYFYVGDLFCIHLGTKYANFQEKIFADISGRKLQTLYSSNVVGHPDTVLCILNVNNIAMKHEYCTNNRMKHFRNGIQHNC